MTKRYDVLSPRLGREEGKVFWHRVGTAFEGEKGIGINFDSLPLPDKDGRVTVRLFEPRQKDDKPSISERAKANGPRPPLKDEISDEIPF